jgi:hypothetical protein
MCGASFRLLVGSSRWPAMAHGTVTLGAVVVAQADEEEDGGGCTGAGLLGQEAGGLEWLK